MKKLILAFFAALCCTVMAFAANGTRIEYETGKFMYFILDETSLTATVTWGGENEHLGTYEYAGAIAIPSTVSYDSKQYNVTSIGESSFNGCSSLTSVIIPNSVKSIGEAAFASCTSLISVTIPNGVTSIEKDAFSYCSGLISATIPNGVTSIEEGAFSNCSGLISVTIPNSVTSIGFFSFYCCDSLTSVTIPSSVESIGNGAFGNCSNLAYIVFLATDPSTYNAGQYVFINVPKEIPVYVPDASKYSGWGEFTNIKGFGEYKTFAKTEINAAKEGVSLSSVDEESVNRYITQIDNANDIADIDAAKTAALAIIVRQPIVDAIAEINEEMDGTTTLTDAEKGWIDYYKARINAATTKKEIDTNKDSALAIIDLRKFKDNAIAEINEEMDGMTTLTNAEKGRIDYYKARINAATTKEEIGTNKDSALAIIDWRKFKDNAIAELNDYIKDMVGVDISGYVSNIENAKSTDGINEILNTAKSLINSMLFVTIGTKKCKLEYNQDTYTFESDITINDKDTYQSNYDFSSTGNISYVRVVKDETMDLTGKWQAWFVPFDMTLKGDDLDKFDAAQVAGVLTDNDGLPVIAFKKMKVGEKMKANIPYVIRPKSGIVQEISLHLLMPEFHSSATTPFVIQSAYDNFTLGGIYEAQQNSNWYALTKDGVFKKMNGAPTPTLQPQRIWMTVSPREDDPYATKSVSTTRSNGTKSTAIPDVIRIVVLGDDGSPEGKPVREAKIINADGQSVNRIQRGQVYRITGNINE